MTRTSPSASPWKLAAALAVGLAAAVANGTDAARDADRFAEERAAFVAAYGAARAGSGSNAPDDERLRAYPLYPYLQAARLERTLAHAQGGWSEADERTHRFLERHEGEPVAPSVRRAWLGSLARRGEARAYLDAYRPDVATEALECEYLAARIETGALVGLAAAILEQWLTPAQLPIACEPVFQWLRDEGRLTDALVERRARALLEAGRAAFARIIAGRLPEPAAAPLLRWADLIEQPARTIDALTAAPEEPVEAQALLDGWSRLARNRPGEALERFGPLVAGRSLDAHERSRLALALALGLAWDRRPEALEFFEGVRPEHLDDAALEWRARAALWAGDWREVHDAVADMSDARRDRTAWRYWAARAAEQLGDRAGARALYDGVIGDDNYYSAMAAARLGREITPHAKRVREDGAVRRQLAARPAFVRARELLRADLPGPALGEWRHGYTDLPRAARLQSIGLAADWGWHHVAVRTATDNDVFNDYALLYPRPYPRAVAAAAELARIDPPLIQALLRQESLFRADAVSPAGAVGLAQLLPPTAQRTAREWGRSVPKRADLFVPEINVTLGAAHLRGLIEAFGGQVPVALAGYNAGPRAAERWLPARPIAADVWVENIPYNETRAYVRRVLWHSLVFKWLETGQPQDAGAWLIEVDQAATERTSAG